MRFVVIGAGAVGGVVGAHLWRAGAAVQFVNRGEHGRVIARDGLRVETPSGTFTATVPAVADPADVTWTDDDVIVLAVKSNDTPGVLAALRAADVDPLLPVVCLQNGVDNEPLISEVFANVYAVPVSAPTSHLEPGMVRAKAGPIPAILDIGRYPSGVDETAEAVAAAFQSAGIVSEVRADIMRCKYAKLLTNLGNAIEVVCGPAARHTELAALVDREGRAVLDAAGIDYADPAADDARRREVLGWMPDGVDGGSSWQSITRGTPVETDHLTGEIVRLGRTVGVPTPVNEVLLALALARSDQRAGPGQVPIDEIVQAAGVA